MNRATGKKWGQVTFSSTCPIGQVLEKVSVEPCIGVSCANKEYLHTLYTINKPVVCSIVVVVVSTRGVAPLVTITPAAVVVTVYGIVVVNMSTVVSSAEIAVVSPVSEVLLSTVTTVAEITRRKNIESPKNISFN